MPNLFIQFTKGIWFEKDAKLILAITQAAGSADWIPPFKPNSDKGPYVRIQVKEVTDELKAELTRSLNVWEWDERELLTDCRQAL